MSFLSGFLGRCSRLIGKLGSRSGHFGCVLVLSRLGVNRRRVVGGGLRLGGGRFRRRVLSGTLGLSSSSRDNGRGVLRGGIMVDRLSIGRLGDLRRRRVSVGGNNSDRSRGSLDLRDGTDSS